MLTLGELIGLVSLCLACFELGYRVGKRDSSEKK